MTFVPATSAGTFSVPTGSPGYAAVLDEEMFVDLLEWCPVGEECEREVWLGHLRVDMEHPVGQGTPLADVQRRNFARARKWARANGLRVFRQKQDRQRGLWGTVAQYIPGFRASENDPLREAPNIAELSQADVRTALGIVEKYEGTEVPELRLELLLAKYYHDTEAGLPRVQQRLMALYNDDPLRLYSRLGLRFFMKQFARLTTVRQAGKISALIMAGQGSRAAVPDGRVIPMLREIVNHFSSNAPERFPEVFRPEHVTPLINIIRAYPSLGDLLLVLDEHCPGLFTAEHVPALIEAVGEHPELARYVGPFLENHPEFVTDDHRVLFVHTIETIMSQFDDHAIERCQRVVQSVIQGFGQEFLASCLDVAFDQGGRIEQAMKGMEPLLRILWNHISSDGTRQAFVDHLIDLASNRSRPIAEQWRAYCMARFFVPEQICLLTQQAPAEMHRIAFNRWTQHSTPVLFDMMVCLQIDGDERDVAVHKTMARNIKAYLRRHRRDDFCPMPAIFDYPFIQRSRYAREIDAWLREG